MNGDSIVGTGRPNPGPHSGRRDVPSGQSGGFNRRQQVQAYRFMARRMGSAVLSGEPETNELPMRRLAHATFAGIMLATFLVAVVGAYGFLRPGGGIAWRDETALIVERETGARYVYRKADGYLHPVVNYVSARLILGSVDPPVRQVTRASLAGVPRGAEYGIAGAPDTLPDRTMLLDGPWVTCDVQAEEGDSASVLLVGRQPEGGETLGVGAPGVLVTERRSRDRFLLWNHLRLRVPDPSTPAVLGWPAVPPLLVGTAFLNAVPAGPDLAAPPVADIGVKRHRVAGRDYPVGQLFTLSIPGAPASDQPPHYILLSDGLSRLSDLMYQLYLASEVPRVATGGKPVSIPLSPDDLRTAPLSTRIDPPGLPRVVPPLDEHPTRALCVSVNGAPGGVNAAPGGVNAAPGGVNAAPGGVNGAAGGPERGGATVSLFRAVPGGLAPEPGAPAPLPVSPVAPTVDRVLIAGGYGALLRGDGGSTWYLLTDRGRKYPIVDSKAAEALGYGGLVPREVPAGLLPLLSSGPPLDSTAADRVAESEPPEHDQPTSAEVLPR